MDQSWELRHLRYFVAVAEELHFGRAAARLHMAQPPLSQQIKKLEQLLHCNLFVRSSRSVSLTPPGSALLERARRTLARISDDMEFIRRVGRGETGTLRVGFVGSAMLTKLPKTLHEYRRHFPDVHLQLQEHYTAAILKGLEEHSIDVGIVRDGERLESLHSEAILQEPFVAILPARHSLARHPRIKVAQLRAEPFVFYPQIAGPTAWERTMQVCEQGGFRPTVVQEAPHWVTIVSLVGAGLGVSIAPACVKKITSADVVSRPLIASKSQSSLELVQRQNESSPVVHAFAGVAKNVFAAGSIRQLAAGDLNHGNRAELGLL